MKETVKKLVEAWGPSGAEHRVRALIEQEIAGLADEVRTDVLGNLIASGEYAYVFHGHTHRRRDRMIGHTRVINPGALGGRRTERRSFCILDLATGETRFVELG